MADSIPKLRRLLNEANARIRELESRAVPEPEVRVVEKPVEVVKYVDRVVEKPVLKEVEKVVYRDNPVEVVRYVDRIVEKPVLKEVKVAYYPPSVERVETEKLVYCQDPAQEETIRQLQDQICRLTSQ